MADSKKFRRGGGLFLLAAIATAFCACTQVPEYCDGYNGRFDTKNQFCFDCAVYNKCGGKTFIPALEVCDGGKVVAMSSICTLTVNRNPTIGGSVKVNGADYSSSVTVDSGAAVNISATAAYGYSFKNWTISGNGGTIADPSKASTSVTVSGNVTVIANFTQNSTSGGGSNDSSVVIGGKTWMNKNLNITTGDSWCYKDSPDSCAKYGRLYTWAAATTACPRGWHLPSRDEWGDLAIAAGGTGDYGTGGTAGNALKATSGWNNNGNGTDSLGFSALPGGLRSSDGDFKDAGDIGHWWTATENHFRGAYIRRMNYNYDYVIDITTNFDKSYGYSVRCVKE
jgi:uncharacterized protein (TIGR02145 family)